MYGAVKCIRRDQGFAFIVGQDGVERFVHFSHLVIAAEFEQLSPGIVVEFVPAVTERGPAARSVRLSPVLVSARLVQGV